MRILILNWRCPFHPRAGGAELLTRRIAERLVAWNHAVTWFTAAYPGSSAHQSMDGVEIVRRGTQTTVHWQAWQWYRRQPASAFDVVIDEINTMPFFSPLYAQVPTIAFIPQLAREVWWHEAPAWLAPVGYLSEPLYLQVYRHRPVVTISPSTRDDLRALGFDGEVDIIPMATDFAVEPALPPASEKEAKLTMLFVGRVVPSKRVDHLVQALHWLHAGGLPAQLWIAGRGDPLYEAGLRRLIQRYALEEAVRFCGKVDEAEKRRLYGRAHFLVACSVREGWGLVVTEANTVGTPAVVYNVPGLRDSTRHDQTGVICDRNTPEALAQAIRQAWIDEERYHRLRRAALEHSRTLNWEVTARHFQDRVLQWSQPP